MKKLAFVGNTSFSVYNFRLGVMKNFVQAGYEVYAIAPQDQYSELFESESIKYIPLEMNGKGTNFIEDYKLYKNIKRIYSEHRFDFVFHYTIKPIIYGSLACEKLNIPAIAITTGLGYAFIGNGFLKKIVIALYKRTLKKTKEVWFLNEDDKRVFLKNNIVSNSKTFVLPGEGVDVSFFQPQEKQNNTDKFIFLFVSRLVKEKGVEEYALAAKKLKGKYDNIECWVLGKTDVDNPNNVPIEKIMKWDEKKYIKYIESVIDVRSFIANSDCVVLPTYYREGIPRCLMEGLSMERPIITTNNVGCIELIRDSENGLLCAQKDVDDLADKMEKMYLQSDETRKKWGENGRKLILEKFDEKIIINQYLEKLDEYL